MTEVVSDNLSPVWIKSLDVDYMFEEQQTFLVEIYDVDDPNRLMVLHEHDFIGSYQFTLGKVVSSKGQEITGNLIGPKLKANSQSKVTIHGSEKKPDYGSVMATF